MPAQSPVLGSTIDRYIVESRLGEGGMAEVFRVRHESLGTIHALKVLRVEGPFLRTRLVQEGRMQAHLQHPNIVNVTDVIDVGGAPGLLMEFVAGPALDQWMRDAPPTPGDAERIFRGILAGVDCAQRSGLVHRDLKPGNVLIAPGLVAKVADFGLAKVLSDSESRLGATRTGAAMGTPAYMSPEQVRDAKHVDQRSDVFALGCILYELCCGRTPFGRADVLSTFSALADGRYVPAESLVPHLAPPIRRAIEAALVADRDQRAPDCQTLLSILDGTGGLTPTGWAPVRPLSPPLSNGQVADDTLPPDALRSDPGARPASAPVHVRAGREGQSRLRVRGAAIAITVAVAGIMSAGWGIYSQRRPPEIEVTATVSPSRASGGEGDAWLSPSLGTMRWIVPGRYHMGSPATDAEADPDEKPTHEVEISGFWLMEHEVTQGQWEIVMGAGTNPSFLSACGSDCPVERVSWHDAVAFAGRASTRDGVVYRLPSESEWEYAHRGGDGGTTAGGGESGAVGWLVGNSGGSSHRVCSARRKRSEWGLCDMTGNVWEWVQDAYHDGYVGAPSDGSAWTEGGADRVARGGGWYFVPTAVRYAMRSRAPTDHVEADLGFRLARSAP